MAQRVQTVVPVVVDQILSCKQQLRIYDTPLYIVCIVGVIRHIRIENNNELFLFVEDHTGSIKALMTAESKDEIASKISEIKENRYAKVFASPRMQGGEKVVFLLKLSLVDDLNIITNHLLQVCAFTLEAKSDRKKQISSANSTGAALADSLMVTDEEESRSAPLNAFERLIFDIVKSECSELGISKRSILRQFPSYQAQDVNRALEHLVNEGLVYYSTEENLKIAVPF